MRGFSSAARARESTARCVLRESWLVLHRVLVRLEQSAMASVDEVLLGRGERLPQRPGERRRAGMAKCCTLRDARQASARAMAYAAVCGARDGLSTPCEDLRWHEACRGRAIEYGARRVSGMGMQGSGLG